MASLVLLMLLGLVLLVLGSDAAVAGARRLARGFGVSDLVVGLTVTSVGTSLPELATSATAAAASGGAGGAEAAGVAVGNIVGSNLFLLTALLGVSGMVRTLHVERQALRRDSIALGIATGAAILVMLDLEIGRAEGVALAVAYLVYLGIVVFQERRARQARRAAEAAEEAAGPTDPKLPWLDRLPGPWWWPQVLRLCLGLGVVVLGADLAVQHGVSLALALGVSGTVVGILLGVGTSLPELVVSVRAAMTGADQISLGNIVGSSLTNILLCLGVAAAVHPLSVPLLALDIDGPFLAAGTLIAMALLWENKDLTRAEGVSLLTLFVLYLFLRATWPV